MGAKLKSSYVSGLVLMAAMVCLYALNQEMDRNGLYADISSGVAELREDTVKGASIWPDRIEGFDSKIAPRMDVWPKERWHVFTAPYHWDEADDEDMRFTLIGEAMATGTVLGTDLYHKDFTALSPVDVAIGWGDFITPEWLSNLNVTFGNRAAHLFSEKLSGVSTNMHTIPGSPDIEPALKKLKKGDRLVLRGYAVRVAASRRWKSWNSDLYFGDLKCEILIVTEIYAEDSEGREKLHVSVQDFEQ